MSLTVDGTSEVVIPVATATSLGVVSVGANLSVDANGVLNAEAPTPAYVLPAATTTTLGGVIVGSGLTVSAGVVSVTPVTPVDIETMYYYSPPAPTSNGEVIPIQLESASGCHIIEPQPNPVGYQHFTVEVTFAVPTTDGMAFELFFMTPTQNPNGNQPTVAGSAGTSIYPAIAEASQYLKFRWSQAQNTWFNIT